MGKFSEIVKQQQSSKDTSKLLAGTNFLDVGVHDVTIQTVDISALEDENKKDFVRVTYADEMDAEMRDAVFVTNRDGDGFSYGLRNFWAAVIPDVEAVGKFLELVDVDLGAFEMFTGMKLRIEIEHGDGYYTKVSGEQKFAAFDRKTDEILTPEFETREEAENCAVGKGLSKSYRRVKTMTAIAAEENLSAFNTAINSGAGAQSESKDSGVSVLGRVGGGSSVI